MLKVNTKREDFQIATNTHILLIPEYITTA